MTDRHRLPAAALLGGGLGLGLSLAAIAAGLVAFPALARG
jgi:hypothetical protein